MNVVKIIIQALGNLSPFFLFCPSIGNGCLLFFKFYLNSSKQLCIHFLKVLLRITFFKLIFKSNVITQVLYFHSFLAFPLISMKTSNRNTITSFSSQVQTVHRGDRGTLTWKNPLLYGFPLLKVSLGNLYLTFLTLQNLLLRMPLWKDLFCFEWQFGRYGHFSRILSIYLLLVDITPTPSKLS